MRGLNPRAFICGAHLIIITLCFSGYTETLRFEEAVKRVLEHNPELTIRKNGIKAAEAAVKQAQVIPNPELEIGLENLGINEIEAAITQPLELGGKRKARIKLAKKELEAARCEMDITRLKLQAETARKFIPIITVHLKIDCIDSLLLLMDTSLVDIRRRINVGAAMQIDALRAEMELDERLLEKTALKREQKQLIRELAMLWGDTSLVTADVKGEIRKTVQLPARDEVLKKLADHPEIKLIKLQQDIAHRAIEEAEAESAPDAAITGGYLRNNETKENAGILGFSIGLPLFNRNKGAIQAATHEYNSARNEYEAALLERAAEVIAIVSEIEGIENELSTLQEKLLPKAEKIYADLYKFYVQGSVGILEVLESRQHLIETHLSTVDLLLDKALLYVELMECTGMKFNIIKQQEKL